MGSGSLWALPGVWAEGHPARALGPLGIGPSSAAPAAQGAPWESGFVCEEDASSPARPPSPQRPLEPLPAQSPVAQLRALLQGVPGPRPGSSSAPPQTKGSVPPQPKGLAHTQSHKRGVKARDPTTCCRSGGPWTRSQEVTIHWALPPSPCQDRHRKYRQACATLQVSGARSGHVGPRVYPKPTVAQGAAAAH